MCHCSVFGCLFARCWMGQHVAVTQWEFLLSRLIVVSWGLSLHHCEQIQLSSGQTHSYTETSPEIQRLCINECLRAAVLNLERHLLWWLHLLIPLTSSPAGLRWHKRLSPPKVFLMDWWSDGSGEEPPGSSQQHPSVNMFSRLKPLLSGLRGGQHGWLSNRWLHLGGISKDQFPRSRGWCWIWKHS